MKAVDGGTVGYLNALNYDVAFYSRRTIPIVSQKDPDLPDYLIAWQTLFTSLPAARRDRFDIVMASNPTSLDGTDEMLLLRQHPGPPKQPPKPTDDYIQASDPSPVISRERLAEGSATHAQSLPKTASPF